MQDKIEEYRDDYYEPTKKYGDAVRYSVSTAEALLHFGCNPCCTEMITTLFQIAASENKQV